MADRLANGVADLEAEKQHAEAALRAKRELVANVSHELRTPVALIRSHVESLLMLADDADAARQREYLPVIHRETEQLSRLIEDTGEGIPPDRLPHVFERFYRGDDARDRASGGAGLGLAIVRELVEAMDGDVSVESTVGIGSHFSFWLPLADGPTGARREIAKTTLPSDDAARRGGSTV